MDTVQVAASDHAELSQQHTWTELGSSSMPLVCNGILCYVYYKMDVMVHDTLVKLATDHFESKDIEAARQLLYSYDAITQLNLKKSRRRQGPAKDKSNVEDILLALHRCRSGLPTFVVADLANLPSLDANGVDFGHILSEFRAMRAEIAVLRREVTHDRGLDQRRWPNLTTARPVLNAMDTQSLGIKLPPTAVAGAQSGTTSTGVVTAPLSGVVTAPSPGVVTAPSPGVVTAPSPSVLTAPSPGVVTAPSPSVLTAPSSGIVTAPLSGVVTAPSSLRHCRASSLRHRRASSLRHCRASSLRHCRASSLCHRRASSLRHRRASSLRHCRASSLRHRRASSLCTENFDSPQRKRVRTHTERS